QCPLARPRGLGVEDEAWGLPGSVNPNMGLPTRVGSSARGHGPRSLALVATGGCGPAHAARLAGALGIQRLILQASAGVASAIGTLGAEVKVDFSRSHLAAFDHLDPAEPDAIFVDMGGDGDQLLERRPAAHL